MRRVERTDEFVVYTAPYVAGNPYQTLLAEALARQGASVRFMSRLQLRTALRAHRNNAIFHLHWQDLLTKANASGITALVFQLMSTAHLLAVLAIARIRGVRTVWTVHNLGPHESQRPFLDRLLGCALGRLVDVVLVHSMHARMLAAPRIRRMKINVAYHGNYDGFYPAARRDRASFRDAVGIPQTAHVLLAFGQIRPYKRIPRLISTFSELDEPEFRLIIAGNPKVAAVRLEVERAAARDPRIILLLDRIPDDEVLELHQAADAAVLAYDDVFSSGALLLALSLGLPVIAPAGSTATELAAPPVVRPFVSDSLSEALRLSTRRTDSAKERAKAAALHYRWDDMAAAVLKR